MAEMMRQMQKQKKEKQSGNDLSSVEISLIKYADSEYKERGLLNWQKLSHPQFSEAEVGGFLPYLKTTPPANKIKEILKDQLEWPIRLTSFLPEIKFLKSEVKKISPALYRVTVWIENRGRIDYPTAMGERNERIKPLILEIKSKKIKILEGKQRTKINKIEALSVKKASWLIQADKKETVKIDLITMNAGSDSIRLQLGGEE